MTVEQYAKDISAFLMWAAEPHLDARKRIGLQVIIFLIVFAGLLYFTKKKVWSSVHGATGNRAEASSSAAAARTRTAMIPKSLSSRSSGRERPDRIEYQPRADDVRVGGEGRGSIVTFSNSQRAKRAFSANGTVASIPSLARMPF